MARPQRLWRLSIRHWRVRTKLAAVLLVPSVAFGVIGGVELTSAVRTSRALQAYSDRVALAREVTGLVHPLQRERDRLAGVLAGVRGASREDARTRILTVTAEDRSAVDKAAATYRASVQGLGVQQDPAVTARIDAAGQELAGLVGLRAAAVQGQLRNDAIFDAYSRLIASLLRVLPDSAGAGDNPEVEARVSGLFDLMQAKELQSQVRGRLFAATRAGSFGLGEYPEFAELRARRTAAVDRFRAGTDPAALSRYEETVRGPAVVAVAGLERSAAERSRSRRIDLNSDRWWLAGTAHLDLLRAAELQFIDAAIAITGLFHTDATGRARAMALWFALIVCVALAASYLVGRSTTDSLRRLRAQAFIVANHTLPDAIRRLSTSPRSELRPEIAPAATGATDEIGEVAEAFDAVHRSALRLAVEQATLRRDISAMFTNLARRSQLLVEGQLRVLDEMEASEQDPDRLAQLFTLDHLTTRLRRNDENLLVLASEESHRMWREAALLSKVLLGALAETEQYQRVRLTGPDDALVAGHVVPDLMHLLAELLDNATAFSPPSTMVAVTATRDGDGMIVTICDSGMGMTRSMLAEANAKLAAPAGIDVSFSERMGLFVVSHLAARHGMTAQLSTAPRGGVRAVVTIPGTAFERPGQPHTSMPDAPASLAERLAAERAAAERLASARTEAERAADDAEHPDRGDGPTRRASVAERIAREQTGPITPGRAAPAPVPVPVPVPAHSGAVDGPTSPQPTIPSLPPPPLREHRRGLPVRSPGRSMPAPAASSDGSAAWWAGDGGRRSGGSKPDGGGKADGERAGGWFGATPRVSEPAEPQTGGMTQAGLPVRVPRSTPAARATAPAAAAATAPPPSAPAEVGTMLARFHSGVRRADDEELP